MTKKRKVNKAQSQQSFRNTKATSNYCDADGRDEIQPHNFERYRKSSFILIACNVRVLSFLTLYLLVNIIHNSKYPLQITFTDIAPYLYRIIILKQTTMTQI